MYVVAVSGRRTLRRAASVFALVTVWAGGAMAAPRKPAEPKPAPAPARDERPDKTERAVVYDDRYRAPARDLLLTPANERKALALVFFMQGTLAEEAGEPDKALPFYLKSLTSDPANVTLALKVSSEFVRRGDTNEAVELLKDAIKAVPTEASPNLALAFIYLRSLRKPDLAVKCANVALEIAPENAAGYAYLAEAYTALNQPAKAQAVLDRAMKAKSRDPQFWLRIGELHRQVLIRDEPKKAPKESVDRTAAPFAKALSLAPDDVEVLNPVATLYSFIGWTGEAIPLYLKILEKSPNQPSVREKLAYSYLQSEQRPKAIETLEAILKQDPSKLFAYEMLAKIYEDDKQFDRAIVNYEQMLLLNPNQPAAYERVAELFAIQLKRPDKAVEVLSDARRRFPDLPGFTYLLARVLAIAKRFPEALSMFEQTIAEAEQSQDSMINGGFYFDWGTTAEQAGRIDKAADLFRKCLKIESEPRIIAQASNYLGYMWVERNENLEEAGQLIQRALQIDPQNGAYLDSLGWYYFRAGKFDKALTELLRAVEQTSPPDATVYDHLGDTYLKLKNEPQALTYWQKAMELEPENQKIAAKISELKSKPTASAAPAASRP